jgi:hypothetical protein
MHEQRLTLTLTLTLTLIVTLIVTLIEPHRIVQIIGTGRAHHPWLRLQTSPKDGGVWI